MGRRGEEIKGKKLNGKIPKRRKEESKREACKGK